VRRWFRSLRAYSFTASLLPVALGAAVALNIQGAVAWWTLPLFALSAVLFHAGTNVLNDYYDFRHGIDVPGDVDPTHAITQGVVSPEFMRVSGYTYFVLGVIVGGVISLARGPLFFAAGVSGAVGALFYTNARLSLKYVALGDMAVFILMGPALVVMAVWALAGRISGEAALLSLPIACLVTAILHGNNMRNIPEDQSAGITTVAILLGFPGSKIFFAALVSGAYISAAVFVVVGYLSLSGLLVAVSLPFAVPIVRSVFQASQPGALMTLPMACARLHLVFGILYTVAVALS
jgi:1,4-dihydroxy-2-naphthoate octaprenyltransferase